MFGAIAMGLQIRQITIKYLLYAIVNGVICRLSSLQYYQSKEFKTFVGASLRLIIAGGMAIALNVTSLLATAEYPSLAPVGKMN